MNLTGQLLERLLRDSGGRRQQQGFVEPIACAQLLGGSGHGPLIRGQAYTGERCRIALHRQLNAVRRVTEGATDKQVVRQHRPETPFDPASGLQDVVLIAQQGFRLAGGQQRWTVFQGQADCCAFDGGCAAGNDLVAAGRRHLYGVGRAGLEGHVARHLQGADGVAGRHGTAAFRSQCRDTAVTTEDAIVIDGDGR
ncbi:hypothetical protein D3C78_1165340 [compost metagenome]